jgi:hypothetical protein
VIVEDEYHYIVRYWKSGIIVTDNQLVPPRELGRAAELALVTITTIVCHWIDTNLCYASYVY